MREIHNIILHCTASPQTQTVQTILNYHRKVKGWKVPGYHVILPTSGEAVHVLDISIPSNGVQGHNQNSINISYIGGIVAKDIVDAGGKVEASKGTPIDNRTAEQRRGLLALVIKYNKMFPKAVILGHRDFSPDKNKNGIIEPSEWLKACPAFEVKTWLRSEGFRTVAEREFLITRANVFLREGAGKNFPSVLRESVRRGTLVKGIAQSGEWKYVEIVGSEFTGFIHSAYLSKDGK